MSIAIAIAMGSTMCSAHAQVLLDVPFVKQPKNLCGPAAVTMVLKYWHELLELEDGVPQIYEVAEALSLEGDVGVLGSDMRRYLASQGFHAFAIEGSFPDLEQHVGRGRPVIVGLTRGSTTHYVVVVGYDEKYVYVNDPAVKKGLRLARVSFNDDWASARSWTLVAVPSVAEPH